MSEQAAADSSTSGGRFRYVLTVAVVVAMLTSLVLAVGYFVELPAVLVLVVAVLWISSLLVAVFTAAAGGKGFWNRIGAAFKMFWSWVFNFGW